MQDRLSKLLDAVLAGDQRIVSYPGTGQYKAISESKSAGISSCGLAALNCARMAFRYQEESSSEVATSTQVRDLLSNLLSQQTAEDIASICSSWTTNAHLEVEDILDIPIFKKSFRLVNMKYGQATRSDFLTLLKEMSRVDGGSNGLVASVITRPPEIVLCFKIPIESSEIFVVFDSHPRPSHPSGSGFVLNSSIETTAAYLDKLLSIDPSILSDPSLRWQAQLLGHFSSHLLIPAQSVSTLEVDDILMDASTQILKLKAELADLKRQELSLHADNEYLSKRVTQLEQSKPPVDWRLQNRPTKATTSWPALTHPSSSSPFTHTQPAKVDLKGKGRAETSRTLPSLGHPTLLSTHQLPDQSGTLTVFHPTTPNDRNLAELAQGLQIRFDEEDRRLAAERVRLLKAHQTFDCRICFDTLDLDYVARINGCDHEFCRGCLRNHVSSTIDRRRYPIFCPACVADSMPEPQCIEYDVVLNLGLSDQTFEVFQELQLTAHSTVLHCRRCKSSMFVDRSEYQATKVLVCPLPRCSHVWCKQCELSIDPSGPPHSCDGSTELEQLMKVRGWRHCPGCETPIQKESGCNHMSCLSAGCNTHFCYVCGEMITQSLIKRVIQADTSTHYRKCKLFEDVGRP